MSRSPSFTEGIELSGNVGVAQAPARRAARVIVDTPLGLGAGRANAHTPARVLLGRDRFNSYQASSASER